MLGSKLKKAICLCCGAMAGLVLTLLSVTAAWCLDQSGRDECLKVEVEGIAYHGEDSYMVQTSVSNRSARDLSMKEFEMDYSFQTEKGWQTVASQSDFHGQSDLPPGASRGIRDVIRIPLHDQDLFRTFEGDVSLRIEYHVHCPDDAGLQTKEHLYWVTPETDKWILREGM